jgi:hypothetical protein
LRGRHASARRGSRNTCSRRKKCAVRASNG